MQEHSPRPWVIEQGELDGFVGRKSVGDQIVSDIGVVCFDFWISQWALPDCACNFIASMHVVEARVDGGASRYRDKCRQNEFSTMQRIRHLGSASQQWWSKTNGRA
jgi:hypothetical protein